MELSVFLFGPLAVYLDGQPVTKFRSTKVQALLAFLLAERAFYGRPVQHQRGALMALCWPDLPLPDAQANLRQTLFRLQHVIPAVDSSCAGAPVAVPLVLADRLSIGLNPAALYDLDLASLLAQVDEIKHHNHPDLLSCGYCYERLTGVMNLYRGDLLADFFVPECNQFEEWAQHKRQRIRQMALAQLYKLAYVQLYTGRYFAAAETAWRQLEVDSLHEPAYLQLMEALASTGRCGEALQQYRRFRHVLESNQIPTSRELEQLAREIRLGTFSRRLQQAAPLNSRR